MPPPLPRVNINIESKAAHTRKAKAGGGAADYRRKTGAARLAQAGGGRVQARSVPTTS